MEDLSNHIFESGWLRDLFEIEQQKQKNKRHHQCYNRHTVTNNRIVKEKANVFFSRFEEFQVRKFQPVHDKLILDKVMSSVIELYFDQASLCDQDLQIEESSTEIFSSEDSSQPGLLHLCLGVRTSLVLTLILLADEVI